MFKSQLSLWLWYSHHQGEKWTKKNFKRYFLTLKSWKCKKKLILRPELIGNKTSNEKINWGNDPSLKSHKINCQINWLESQSLNAKISFSFGWHACKDTETYKNCWKFFDSADKGNI